MIRYCICGQALPHPPKPNGLCEKPRVRIDEAGVAKPVKAVKPLYG